MSAVSFRSLVLAACNAGDALQTALEALQARARTMSYPAYRDAMAPIVGERVGETPYESRKGGGLTFKKNSAGEQRMKRLLRLHPDHVKPANKAESKVRGAVVTATVRDARAAVIAAGLTKAEFVAFMQELRNSVAFK